MQPFHVNSFLQKYAAGLHTEAEHQQFTEWLKTAPMAEVEDVLSRYAGIVYNIARENEGPDQLVSRIEDALDQYELGHQQEKKKTRIITMPAFARIAAAVVLFVVAGSAAWLMIKNSKQQVNTVVATAPSGPVQQEAAPGGNKATLTLSDGSVIALDDTKNGQVARQGSTQVTKSASGQLVYKVTEKPLAIAFNTLTTPRGGQFKLVLPDGSEVWLNAASSIKYPTAFTGSERKVEISGEAYFEIAHNALMPFKVSVNGMEIKVLGTHFNVNAYNDEAAIKTTLLQGSIQLSNAGAAGLMLQPGQQAQLSFDEKIKVLSGVDVEEVVAWKNGYFSFNRADLQTVMRQLARWYNVDISYEGKIPYRLFGGKIDRNSNASEVLKILEESKVHFSIADKKIIVRP